MAIADLLWACPLCGRERGLRSDDRSSTCRGCGTSFRRARGAAILARRPDGTEDCRAASDWLETLPPLSAANQPAKIGPERAILRLAGPHVAVRTRGAFVGWGERFGPRLHGRVLLTSDALAFETDRGAAYDWPLDRLTGVQPTSSALQIKARDRPVAFLRFLEGSVRLWEHHIQHRLRMLFRDTGRGEIVEFQPRISTR
jgi:hypothetical protein